MARHYVSIKTVSFIEVFCSKSYLDEPPDTGFKKKNQEFKNN